MVSRPSFSANEPILRAGVSLEAVRAALPLVDPEAVLIRQAGLLMRRTWAPGIFAVTLPWGVYAHPRVMWWWTSATHDDDLVELISHELVHIQQLRSNGTATHAFRYARDYLSGRSKGKTHQEAYVGIPAEVEARALAHEIVTRG